MAVGAWLAEVARLDRRGRARRHRDRVWPRGHEDGARLTGAEPGRGRRQGSCGRDRPRPAGDAGAAGQGVAVEQRGEWVSCRGRRGTRRTADAKEDEHLRVATWEEDKRNLSP